MSSVINRSTREYRRRANTPDFPVADWIINPDMSAVEGVPKRYWVISGDSVMEMSAPAKAVVDDDIAGIVRDVVEEETKSRALIYVLRGLVKTINLRLPTTDKITASELETAIRGEIDNG